MKFYFVLKSILPITLTFLFFEAVWASNYDPKVEELQRALILTGFNPGKADDLWGVHPDLGNLNDGDMVFTMDYRSVYERILGDWFMLKENKFFKFRNDELKNIFRNS